jgi:hypothetical protein
MVVVSADYYHIFLCHPTRILIVLDRMPRVSSAEAGEPFTRFSQPQPLTAADPDQSESTVQQRHCPADSREIGILFKLPKCFKHV